MDGLRDIQLPDPVGLWPLAMGWYILFVFLLILLTLLVVYFIRRSIRLRPRHFVLHRLIELRNSYQREANAAAIAAELSLLLRRASLVAFPRQQVAGLQGESWLRFLDETGNTHEFSEGIGRVLVTAPYQTQAQFEVGELLDLVTRWVAKNVIA